MALTPGTRIGVYDILATLGEGGMGVVYRARDTKLDRDVAIKVLPDAFIYDVDRLARFAREAKTLASLNHPHIAQVYGVEDSGGTHALVMELIEGEDLAQRLTRGPISLDEALPIARQIAEALEAAHDAGIIHRDLKPANIKLRDDGTVKVLDFGLAKAVERAGSGDTSGLQTITSPAAMTAHGVILGTAAYMSPEQAKGRAVDKRADVWAFGVVLYEMLTGRPPFAGESIAEVLGDVLKSDIDFARLPQELPAPIGQLLHRCLERDPKLRLRDLGEARIVLSPGATNAFHPAAAAPRSSRSRWLPWSVAAIAVAAAVALALSAPRATQASPEPVRFEIVPSPEHKLIRSGVDRVLSISRDGRMLAYASVDGSLMVRRMDGLEARPLPGITTARTPFFSPDGKWIGYFDGTASLQKVPVAGGPSLLLCKITSVPRGASWGEDDTIVFATGGPSGGLFAVPATGGDATVLTKPDASKRELFHQLPWILPRGKGVLFTTIAGPQASDMNIAVRDAATGELRTLIRGANDARYLEPGYLLYASAGALKVVAFDLSSLSVTGEPLSVAEGVATARTGAAQYDVSANGTLLYVAAEREDAVPLRSLVWRTRSGEETPVANAPRRVYSSLRLSPDGSRLALEISDQGNDIWVWHFANQTLTRLTSSPESEVAPVWTPDGKRIVFGQGQASGGLQLLSQPADGSRAAEPLTEADSRRSPTSFSPDGKTVVLRDYDDASASYDLIAMELATQRTDVLVATPLFTESEGQLSPDGRWLAYQSNVSRQAQIYVNSFPEVGRSRVQVSSSGGSVPAWSHDGRELFFASGNYLYGVRLSQGPAAELAFGPPTRLFDFTVVTGGESGRSYDVSPDGQRFIVIKPSPSEIGNATAPQTITVVIDWRAELKQRLAATSR